MNKKYYIVNDEIFKFIKLRSFTNQYYTWYNIIGDSICTKRKKIFGVLFL